MGHHFELVHGACHGAWEWYKLAVRLEKAGHKATALDLAGCGIRPAGSNTITTYSEYLKPLKDFMAFLPVEKDDEKVANLSQIMQRPLPITSMRVLNDCNTYTPEWQGQVPWVYIKFSQDRVNIPAQQKYFAENFGPFAEVAEIDTCHLTFLTNADDHQFTHFVFLGL